MKRVPGFGAGPGATTWAAETLRWGNSEAGEWREGGGVPEAREPSESWAMPRS